MLVKRFTQNTIGNDYIHADVHGAFTPVIEALRAVNFDQAKDRLFCVGDLIDRGPESLRALDFLKAPFVHSVRGNHEDMILSLYAEGEPHPATLQFATNHNGMAWWRDTTQAQREALLIEFRKLPIAIEIETARGTVGIIHAEVPRGMTWSKFLDRIERGDKDVTECALWSRSRIVHGDDTGVPGIGRVFCGHTPVGQPKQLGNVFYLDTGSVFGLAAKNPDVGRLTFANINAGTSTFAHPPAADTFDLRIT